MEKTQPISHVLPGGAFLIRESRPEDTFIPEEISEEQQMFRQMAEDFREQEIFANEAEVERKGNTINADLLRQAGELGLLGTHMPAAFGGTELDTNSNTVISDALGPAGSFSTTIAAHTGIGMLPILYFGTEAQKEKYLPRLISGELKASYCLTEPGSGSDALNAKTRADRSPDGKHYVLNGQKMWITNAGFADLFLVFAKVDGTQFTGFIVEAGTPGLILGAEEDKMGIRGSSTRQVFFENMAVPAENVLGEIGKGHLVALIALNIGRYKLGLMCAGSARRTTSLAVRYANERVQFGVPISSFGAIRYKLAEMAIRTFAAESASYRLSQLMEETKSAASAEGKSYANAMLEAGEEYAIECAILKVLGSEVVDYCVDENVQVHGGIGFSEEYSAARLYRNARINRIYEGTNEINRLVLIDQLFRRAAKGQLDLMGPALAVQKELSVLPEYQPGEDLYKDAATRIAGFRKIALLVIGAVAKMQMDGKINLKSEQEILINCADMLIDLFAAESVLLRVEKLAGRAEKRQPQAVYDAMLQVYLQDAGARMVKSATDAVCSFADGDSLTLLVNGIRRFGRLPLVNVKEKRRLVADALCAANGWCF